MKPGGANDTDPRHDFSGGRGGEEHGQDQQIGQREAQDPEASETESDEGLVKDTGAAKVTPEGKNLQQELNRARSHPQKAIYENYKRSPNPNLSEMQLGFAGGGNAYSGQSISVSMNEINDQDRRDQQGGANNGIKRGTNMVDEQFNKKQMEFKGGKLHQIISDQVKTSNKIFANRYQGAFGLWYFIVDSTIHFENLIATLLLLLIIFFQDYNQLDISFPIVAVSVNVVLMSTRNLTLEWRQRKVTNKINNIYIEYLMISRKVKKFVPITWADVKPGYILRVKSGQEFPADCLILDIQGAAGQKCFVTSGPFDNSTGIIQKKSYQGTSNKTGSSKQNEQHFAEMISGFLKYEYNYFGYIQGSFKLNENPAAAEFDHDNVVQRGALLTQTPQVICLVLNVGDQCMGSVYKDPKQSRDSTTNLNLKSMVKTQRSFDKAYKQSIRTFLIFLTVLYGVLTGLAIYLASNSKIFSVTDFERSIMENLDLNTLFYIQKAMGFLSILLSSIPLSFSNIIDLLVLMHTNFAEWDVNLAPANIEFLYPHATLAFGKVAHMFFSRTALQRDDQQCVKVFHVGGHFFLNKVSQQLIKQSVYSESQNDLQETTNLSFEKGENSLDYLPNEIKSTKNFFNDDADFILSGPKNINKQMVIEFFRAIVLCHQASVAKQKNAENQLQYICVLHDEVASLEFAQQQNFKLIQRANKMITIHLQGNQERYDELGVVTTKAVMGHFMTVSAMKLQGDQAGILYMKGSIASLKHYFINKESDFQYLNNFEQKFIQSGFQSVVYAKRQLTIEETNQLIITINESNQQTRENVEKLDALLYNLTSIQLEILGVLGVQKSIHMRNRVAVDDMILNGVKPWIISKEDEQTHLTSLNSLRIFHNCANPLIINGQRERVVMDQIQTALKVVLDRMSKKSSYSGNEDLNTSGSDLTKTVKSRSTTVSKGRSAKAENKNKKSSQSKKRASAEDQDWESLQKKNQQNVVIFTGRALVEILRDQTMQKSFITLAYICDMMVGSEISPLQKQKLLKIVKSYIGEGEYAAALIATTEDQFMANEADLVANFKTRGKSADFQAVSDATFKDFSAISYLLFKHGNQIQMRLSKAAQAFFYRTLVTFLILTTYMIESGFSGALPYSNFYYLLFMLFLAPGEILIYSIFYKDYAYDYLYRIFGHYKYNFSFTLVEIEFVAVDSLCAFYDWAVIYLPQEIQGYGYPLSLVDGKNCSTEAYYCYQVVLMQIIFFFYFKNTNVQVVYSVQGIFVLTIIGIVVIFDEDGLVGPDQFFTSPSLLFCLLFQLLMLSLRNSIVEVVAKLLLKRQADLLDWYMDIEEKLSYEEYEDANQVFSIQQYQPLYQKINAATIQNTLRLINSNMMKCPKTDGLEQIIDKINTELDIDMRGSQQVALSGSINRWTLQLNDLNKETEYQDNKNSREIIYVKRQILVFLANALLFTLFGLSLSISEHSVNIGTYYYAALSLFSIVVVCILPRITNYISNILLFYTIVIIFCYTIYTSESESLQPAGLIFVLALVAGLNHSYIYPTMVMILVSVMMNIFFSFLAASNEGSSEAAIEKQAERNSYISSFSIAVRIFTGLVWSSYVYVQELEKKTQFINGHRKVRNFLKLKSILNILVPSLVRDKIRSGKKNFSEDEGEVTIVFIDIYEFDNIVKAYYGRDLLALLDTVYNAFDQLCDQFGLQKIETVGKTYMACGGLKSAEKKIDEKLLNRHHSVRATDFAMEASNYVKTTFLKNGQPLQVLIGIHTGEVISGVVGETKPQFSLIGDTVNKTSRVCSKSQPKCVSVSKQTHHYLQLYTNNYSFQQIMVFMKGIGTEPIYYVSNLRGKIRTLQDKTAGPKQNLHLKENTDDKHLRNQGKDKNEKEGPNNKSQALQSSNNQQSSTQQIGGLNYIKEVESGASDFESNYRTSQGGQPESHRGLLERENQQAYADDEDQQFENESDKYDIIDDGTMNVFGFNDDLNLDDRLIIQNATENQLYNLVERPKYLLSFELKDSEQEFLFYISKQESKKTSVYLACLLLLNKIVIFSDIMQEGTFQFTIQFYFMLALFLFELLLIYKLNNPQYQQIYFWTYMLLFYGIFLLGFLLSYQAKYLGNWTYTAYNELQIQLTLSLIFMMRSVLLRHYIITYAVYLFTWILVLIIMARRFDYQIIQFIIGQILYAILLGVGVHHREMIQRKSLNYERILNVEIEKTNVLISKLVPLHMLAVIINEKKQVDEFDDCTLLYTDMVGFTAFSKNVNDPKEVVKLLSKLFSRFDQLCDEHKVYKVHTIGDCYVIMGYNGRVDKNKRNRAVVIDEAIRVIKVGLQMIETINEVKKGAEDNSLSFLDMRIGIHTGKVVAGIIGSKLVRYDIFGVGVLIANKMESNGLAGAVCISEDTLLTLLKQPEVANEFYIKFNQEVSIPSVGRKVKQYVIEQKKQDSFDGTSLDTHSAAGSHDNKSSSKSAESRSDQIESSEHEGSDLQQQEQQHSSGSQSVNLKKGVAADKGASADERTKKARKKSNGALPSKAEESKQKGKSNENKE